MGAATDNSASETQDRLALLLIAQPREGWESDFEELIRREIQRLVVPSTESGCDEHP